MIQASFFWKNNEPGGIGITFGPPSFTTAELQMMFTGPVAKKFMADSDNAMGSSIVGDMMSHLAGIGQMKQRSEPISSRMLILAALNILWLSKRGFIANDEFNGVQFIGALEGFPAMTPKPGMSP